MAPSSERRPQAGQRLAAWLGALAEEQQLDPRVRRGLERRRPAGGRRPFLPSSSLQRSTTSVSLLGPPALEHRRGDAQQLRRLGVRLGMGDAGDHGAGLLREEARELAPRLLVGDDDDLRLPQAPHEAVELVRHPLQVLVDELVGVPLQPCLGQPPWSWRLGCSSK